MQRRNEQEDRAVNPEDKQHLKAKNADVEDVFEEGGGMLNFSLDGQGPSTVLVPAAPRTASPNSLLLISSMVSRAKLTK